MMILFGMPNVNQSVWRAELKRWNLKFLISRGNESLNKKLMSITSSTQGQTSIDGLNLKLC